MPNKPKLRFKEFNDSIVECRIENVLKIKHGKDQKAIECKDGIYPILATSGEIGRTNTYLWTRPCVLIGRKGTINKPQYMDTPFWTVDTLFYSDVNSSNIAKYLYYLFNTINWKRYDESTGVPSLSAKTVERIKVIITNNKDEQKKIAEFLSKVDEIIAEREEEVKDLEKQKKGLMQKIFSQQLRFTDSNNNPYPEWEEKKIGDVFEFYNGKAHEQEIDENGEYIVVNSKFISTEGQVKKYTNKVICPLIKDNIVLVMSDVPNGKAMSKCYLIEEDNKYSLNQRICCLRTKDVARFFIYQISRNKYFLKFDNGVSQTNLRKEDVLKCPIQVPCLEEQQKIANVLSKLDELIEEKKALLSDWQSFKKGLLQQMFV